MKPNLTSADAEAQSSTKEPQMKSTIVVVQISCFASAIIFSLIDKPVGGTVLSISLGLGIGTVIALMMQRIIK